MANEYLVNKADLDSIADKIALLAGSSGALIFPDGFLEKLEEIGTVLDGLTPYTLNVEFKTTNYIHPGSGATVVDTVGLVAKGNVNEIAYIETVTMIVESRSTSNGRIKLNLKSATNCTCEFDCINESSGIYSLTISKAIGGVQIVIDGVVP